MAAREQLEKSAGTAAESQCPVFQHTLNAPELKRIIPGLLYILVRAVTSDLQLFPQ